jgi:hypothetical protein
MSPEQRNQVERTSAVVRAVMDANRSGDAMAVAFDIVGAAMLICDGDQQLKSALAWFMRRQAERLDHDMTNATTLQ